jgi:hypothetical protein
MTAPSVSAQAPDLQQPTDATLIRRSLAEPEVFAVLFDRYAADIHHYAARRLGASAADDLVSETFLVAGADMLDAPGLTRLDDIRRVVSSSDRPVSVLGPSGGLDRPGRAGR